MTPNIDRRSLVAGMAGAVLAPAGAIGASNYPRLNPAALMGAAVDVRSFGAKADGVFDNTQAFLYAHKTGLPVYYPKTPGGFFRISGRIDIATSAVSDGAEIRMTGDGSHGTEVFRISGHTGDPLLVSGFWIDGGYVGGMGGEWSHGVNIIASSNVQVLNNTITNIYGDCVSMTSDSNGRTCENITISGNFFTNPRRCNVAIISGRNIVITQNLLTKLNDYVSAIDLEPNLNGRDFVSDIEISHNRIRSGGVCVCVTVANSAPSTRIHVLDNDARGQIFFSVHASANLNGADVRRNQFLCTMPRGGSFGDLTNAKQVLFDSNIDTTSCSLGYSSIRAANCSGLTYMTNRFCGPV